MGPAEPRTIRVSRRRAPAAPLHLDDDDAPTRFALGTAPPRSAPRAPDDDGPTRFARGTTPPRSRPPDEGERTTRLALGTPVPGPRPRPPSPPLRSQESMPAAPAAPSPAPSAPAPPALAPDRAAAVFALVRRMAIQTDLAAATAVLARGAGALLGAEADCALLDPATGEAWSPADGRGAAPAIAAPLLARVARGHGVIAPRELAVPVGGAAPLAALAARRALDAPPFDAADARLLAAIAAEATGLLRHFLDDHAAGARDAAADAHPLFRAEALRGQRDRGAEGEVILLPPGWVRWAYPAMLGIVAAAALFVALAQVPTYSSGAAIVVIDGTEVTAPAAGTVAEVRVAPGQRVAAGAELVRLTAVDEQAAYDEVDDEYRRALASFLFDPSDDAARTALATIAARRAHARATLDARVVRAPAAGVVSDVRVRPGALLVPGAHILELVGDDAEPQVVALLPGQDRPRIAPGMTLEFALAGYTMSREDAVVTDVGSEVVGPTEARRYLGDQVADSLRIAGPVVIVKARLPGRSFDASGRSYAFHDGMPGTGEIRLETHSLLRLLVGDH